MNHGTEPDYTGAMAGALVALGLFASTLVTGLAAGSYDDSTKIGDDNTERTRAADTLLLGRETLFGFRNHFVAVPDDPDADVLNRLFAEIDKLVVSDTLPGVRMGS